MSNVYSLYDCKASTYSAPFLAGTDDEAKRILLDIALHGDNLISKHYEDFSLVSIGEFDNHTGLITGFDCLKFVESASNLMMSFREKVKSSFTPNSEIADKPSDDEVEETHLHLVS